MDFSRARRFVRGYASIVPLSPDQASVIPVYLRGREAPDDRQASPSGPERDRLPQVQWLSANAAAAADALAAAVP
jgi:hypothetical protein